MSARQDLKAKIEESAARIEQLTDAVAGQKAETAVVVRDLDVKLRYRRWLHNAICESPLLAPLIPHSKREND